MATSALFAAVEAAIRLAFQLVELLDDANDVGRRHGAAIEARFFLSSVQTTTQLSVHELVDFMQESRKSFRREKT
ncbi:MAG: hypothetical protein GY738_09230 [Pseudoalteromonas sp.]|nr:hypothetical protein [Pseudoalteromonas sp.]